MSSAGADLLPIFFEEVIMENFCRIFFDSEFYFYVALVMLMIAEGILMMQAVRDCRLHNEEADLSDTQREEMLLRRERENERQKKLFIYAVRQNLLPELYEYRIWKQKQQRRAELRNLLFIDEEDD